MRHRDNFIIFIIGNQCPIGRQGSYTYHPMWAPVRACLPPLTPPYLSHMDLHHPYQLTLAYTPMVGLQGVIWAGNGRTRVLGHIGA